MRYCAYFLMFALVLLGCKENGGGNSLFKTTNYEELPAMSGDLINMVVEIPAGTNHKIEYDREKKRFINDQIDGEDRVIDFLPYPGNYGFIPGTLMDKAKGGDGDALDILVIGEAQETGAVMTVIPLASLVLTDRGELDTKIIAIPAESSLRTIQADDFLDFMLEYDAARKIIEDWFLNYKGRDVVQLIRWEDDQFARAEILKFLN